MNTQLSVFDFVEDVKVPEIICERWELSKDRFPTITSYTDALAENIRRWQAKHPEQDFFVMWDCGGTESEWSKYMKSVMRT